jgi:predicted MPP superfamily phosphohydrolase
VLTRRAALKGVLATTVGAITGAGIYGVAYERHRIGVTEAALPVSGLPSALDGLRIGLITDIHHSSMVAADDVATAVRLVLAAAPDLIVLGGDYVTWGERGYIGPVAELLAPLRARHGVFAILGNHDWWDDLTAQRERKGPIIAARALRDVGIPVLENDAVRLTKGGQPFWVAGLGDQIAYLRGRGRFDGVDDVPGTLAKVDDGSPVILLAHEPDIFPKVPERVALTLSGHTHGGQVRLFGYSPMVPSKYGNRYAYGHVVEEGRHLIVSGGLGTSILPVRFGVPPEILLIELGESVSA